MLKPDIKIVRTDQTARIAPSGNIVNAYRVQFMVGEQGPFAFEISEGYFTPENVEKGVERIADTVRAIAPAKSPDDPFFR